MSVHSNVAELLNVIRNAGCNGVKWDAQELLLGIAGILYGSNPKLFVEKHRMIDAATNAYIDNDITDTQPKLAQGIEIRNYDADEIIRVSLNLETGAIPANKTNLEDLINVDNEKTYPAFAVLPGEIRRVEFKSPCIKRLTFDVIDHPKDGAVDSDEYAADWTHKAPALAQDVHLRWTAWTV